MKSPYTGFVGQVWKEFPQLSEWHNLDNDKLPIWKLEKFIDAGYHNFVAERKPLYHLSKLVEQYAQENNQPLLSTFEKIAKYKFVENRYQDMIKQMPKIWIVADFGKIGIKTPLNIELLNCRDKVSKDVASVKDYEYLGSCQFV